MPDRSESEILTGLLHVVIDGKVRDCPTLKAGHVASWGRQLTVDETGAKPLLEWTASDASSYGEAMVGRMVDLVVAYDVTGSLGGREYLLEHADPAELRAALNLMAGNAFPFGNPVALVDLAVRLSAAQSVRPNTTNGSSPTGISRPNRSTRRSTRNK